MKPKLLLVEDDPTLGYALKTYLEMHDYEVEWQADGQAGEQAFRQQPFDLCILDIMLPNQDGFSLAEALKREQPDIPVIFLTARAMKIDKLRGFRLGADDYIVKPVDEEELLARIQAVWRRSKPAAATTSSVYAFGSSRFEWHNRRLQVGEAEQYLTEKEARLLQLLCTHQNQLLERSYALRQIWGKSDYFNRRSMDVHIARLRKYLKADPAVSIVNLHGQGFILEVRGQKSRK